MDDIDWGLVAFFGIMFAVLVVYFRLPAILGP